MEKKIERKNCPVCGVSTSYTYHIQDQYGNKSLWYRCPNGVIFQSEYPDYITEGKALPVPEGEAGDIHSGVNLRRVHTAYLYSNLIEDMTFGRFMLSVGFTLNPEVLKFMGDRGWLAWGIDDRNFQPGGKLYRGNFIDYDFDVDKKELKEALGHEEKIKRKFDLIWMEHYLERVPNPIEVLKRAVDLLSETGILFLSVPDIEFINKRGVAGWIHWDKKTNYIFWSKRALVKELEKFGMEVIVCRRNYTSRTDYWDDLQIVAQRKYY